MAPAEYQRHGVLAAMGAIDLIYVHAPDRLARSYAHQAVLVEEFGRAGAEVVFLNRPIGQTPEDTLLLQLQGMFAEYERTRIAERSRRGKRHRAQAGSVSVLSRAPYGYRYVACEAAGGAARFEVAETEAEVVRRIFRKRCGVAVLPGWMLGVVGLLEAGSFKLSLCLTLMTTRGLDIAV